VKRREFITLLGGAAAAWPHAARAQKAPTPVIGFLENVTIIYRWAEDRADRLPEMASELAQQAIVIVTTGGPPAAFAAKAATTTIPIAPALQRGPFPELGS
jgi:putative tryptophan/tyrosine transport system substrate-binding protein